VAGHVDTAERALSAAAYSPDAAPSLLLCVWSSMRRRPTIWAGGFMLVALTACAVFAPFLGTTDPNDIAITARMRFPSEAWWFGTDSLGRDLYSRVIYGSRVSLFVGLSVAGLATVFGVSIGLVAGMNRMIDMVAMRIVDGMMAIPPILLAIALAALAGASVANVIAAVTIGETPRVVRLMRSVVLSAREEPYVEGAITSGTKPLQILWRHILPNTMSPILVQATYIFASAMIAEAALSFIGAGIPSETPSWGNIMSEARALWQIRPYIVFIPAAFLSVAVLSVNMIGDGLRDALDPRLVKKL
jgi:peptide/nickel transport system permease protein